MSRRTQVLDNLLVLGSRRKVTRESTINSEDHHFFITHWICFHQSNDENLFTIRSRKIGCYFHIFVSPFGIHPLANVKMTNAPICLHLDYFIRKEWIASSCSYLILSWLLVTCKRKCLACISCMGELREERVIKLSACYTCTDSFTKCALVFT